MSASPPLGPHGQKPTPPPGAPPLRRPRGNGNPLVARKPPIKRPPPVPGSSSAKITNLPGTAPKPAPPRQQAQQAPPNFDEIRRQNDGWTFPKPPDAQDYPLYITKKALKEGLRFHVMKFVPPHGRLARSGSTGIDPTNQDEFARPVTLQRRDPRQPPPGREVKEDVSEPIPVDNEEAQKIAQAKADREAQRALDDAQKAPVARDPNPKRQQPKEREKKHGTQVHYEARTEEQKKQAEIRYEEALPWHLEDADGKNVWVGQYEAPLSHAKVGLQIHGGGFRMIPLEKWYKFTSKRGAIQTMSIEEAEKVMGKKMPIGRWAIRDAQREKTEQAMNESRTIINGRTAVKQESGTFKQASRREKQDHDDIDFSGEEFQDDDENPGYEPDRDEEVKEVNDRIRREQLKANAFGETDEKEVDKEEDEEKREELERKLFGKGLRKALKRRDKQFQYDDSDSSRERDPFASSESETDTDTEDEKKEEEQQKGDKDKANGSENNTKGSNTPQGKKAAAEAAKKGKSLKRPGSPLPSDSSGTESTRKKKKTGPSSSIPGSRGDTPLPRRTGAGSTSDAEGTAGEMSDGAVGKKKKRGPLGQASPAGSRAGSPAPTQQGKSIASSSKGAPTGTPRAGSPDNRAEPIDVSKYINPPTVQEIIDALPPRPEGVSMKKFITTFKSRLERDGQPDLMPQKVFLKLVLSCSVYSKEDKLLRRKPDS
ncbi:hypothetical protein DL770_006351 [Monosporascus sp. CRB-9-2]|nr:hypothetical protein DL770_006351 [Monosporascus sp. CRB-9-2]